MSYYPCYDYLVIKHNNQTHAVQVWKHKVIDFGKMEAYHGL